MRQLTPQEARVRKARTIRVARGQEGVSKRVRRIRRGAIINLQAAVRQFKRTGKLPQVDVEAIRMMDSTGIDKAALKRMIQIMLQRGGVELNPGPNTLDKGKEHVSDFRCYNCGEAGHKQRDCPKPPNPKKRAKERGPRNHEGLVEVGRRQQADQQAGAVIAHQDAEKEKEDAVPVPQPINVSREGINAVARYGDFRKEIHEYTSLIEWFIFISAIVLSFALFVGSMFVVKHFWIWIMVRLLLMIVQELTILNRLSSNTVVSRVRFWAHVLTLPFSVTCMYARLTSVSYAAYLQDLVLLLVQLFSAVEVFWPQRLSEDWRVPGQMVFRPPGDMDRLAIRKKKILCGFVAVNTLGQCVDEEGELLPTQHSLEHETNACLRRLTRYLTDVGADGKIRTARQEVVISMSLEKLLRTKMACTLGCAYERMVMDMMRYAENQNSIRLPPDNDVSAYPITLATVYYAADVFFSVPSPLNLNGGEACFY
jgi:hypothetical protein